MNLGRYLLRAAHAARKSQSPVTEYLLVNQSGKCSGEGIVSRWTSVARYVESLLHYDGHFSLRRGAISSTGADPSGTAGTFIWLYISIVSLVHVIGRIFAMPASITLLNNCSPHPSVLGVVHGSGQSTSAAFRTIGPVFAGWLYGRGYAGGAIVAVWWPISGLALASWFVLLFVTEGSGHEIILPDEEDMGDAT